MNRQIYINIKIIKIEMVLSDKQKWKHIPNISKPIKIKRSISFDTSVNVILIPEAKEYEDLKHLLWYNDEEMYEFLIIEREFHKQEKEQQQNELNNMRNEEIYTIMLSY